MTHLVDIFLQPSKVFVDLKARPTFWVPLLLLAVASAVMVFLYYMKVDSAWVIDHTLLASGNELSAAEMEQMRKSMPDAKTMGYIGAPAAAFVMVVMSMLYAVYFMLAGKIAGAATSFRHGLSLTCWASMPMLLGIIIAIVGVMTMTPQTPLESLMLANADQLFAVSSDSAWYTMAKSFSLLNFWVWFLLALGWRTWTGSGWVQAIIVAILPSVVIYGVMAVFAVL